MFDSMYVFVIEHEYRRNYSVGTLRSYIDKHPSKNTINIIRIVRTNDSIDTLDILLTFSYPMNSHFHYRQWLHNHCRYVSFWIHDLPVYLASLLTHEITLEIEQSWTCMFLAELDFFYTLIDRILPYVRIVSTILGIICI
jgi:hypothetical protein